MAKTLIGGQTVTNQYGDIWDAAILVVDHIKLDFKEQEFGFRIDIYKDVAARTASMNPIQRWVGINKTEFLANFDPGLAATTLKAQSEDYTLTIEDGEGNLYSDKFE